MNNYWAGVFTGLGCALIFYIVTLGIFVNRIQVYEEALGMIEARQQKLEAWQEENMTVMQTYKFFNESWQAILDLRTGKEQ